MSTSASFDDVTRKLNVAESDRFDTREHLKKARLQAQERGYDELFIADVDAHHYETESWPDVAKYIEDPVLRHRAEGRDRQGRHAQLMYSDAGTNQHVAGRIVRYPKRSLEETPPDQPRDVSLLLREMDSIGINQQIVFPTPMLLLGLHPDPTMEVQLSWAYTRWLTEELLPQEPRIKTMVYLPFNDPDATMRAIEAFGDLDCVAGFMVTSTRYKAVHGNEYMPIYRALEERGMPLAFHPSVNTRERMFEGMNRFLSVHALGFVVPNLVHVTNLVINGIPERFPDLKVIIMESGLAWIPFLMQRLDNEYMMRSSEAPLLRKRPSEYMREHFYYTTQPMETGDPEALELTLEMINADTQLLFASDYPHWDFNLPSTIYDLDFLKMESKKNILGENARRVLKLD